MKRIAAGLLALSLAGCATRYGELGISGGVQAEPIMPGVYRIIARGNGYTASSTVQDFMLLKAAETTLANGGTHFIIGGVSDRSRSSVHTTPGTMEVTRIGNNAYGTYTPGTSFPIYKPGSDAIITILNVARGQMPPPGALDAKSIAETIGPRVKSS